MNDSVSVIDRDGWICDFDCVSGSDGGLGDKDILGNKGANLAEMCNMGISVPPGFVIGADVMRMYYKVGQQIPEGVSIRIKQALERLGDKLCKGFGDLENPLVVSVRSGAGVSMPGMMDTILNLGLNDVIVKHQNNRCLYDSYRRLIQMYSSVVLGVESYFFEDQLESVKREYGLVADSELGFEHLIVLIDRYKSLLNSYDLQFPQDVYEQFYSSVIAVFGSWMNSRAVAYRKIGGISDDIGTAVSVQSMVFGNLNEKSASGVIFTRNPSDGEKQVFGEYLINSQGEDIVAGVRTPDSVSGMQDTLFEAYNELLRNADLLEKHYKDVQDIEFTVEDDKLWILQTRSAKKTSIASIRVIVDFVHEEVITKEEAIMRLGENDLTRVLHSTVEFTKDTKVIANGLPASPGAESGIVVFSSDAASKKVNEGFKVVLVRGETSPEDIVGMQVAMGFITVRGGMTSHAAVVARSMGKACVCGIKDMVISQDEGGYFKVGGFKVRAGDHVTIDGATGTVMIGETRVLRSFSEHFRVLMGWIKEFESIGVKANADTPQDAKIARDFGAVGIGLCRTEHMFFVDKRIDLVREMIFAEEKHEVLIELEKCQKSDFTEIFRVVADDPVIIRLLDPPLHEFLPKGDAIEAFASRTGFSVLEVRDKVNKMQEENPMLGHRGCRLGVTCPEIYKMQLVAIFEAAVAARNIDDVNRVPWIMVPFIMGVKELNIIRKLVEEVAKGFDVSYKFGAMIEIPSAALSADEIASSCDFISFGTNDLTQTILGLSRDDIQSFVDVYKGLKVFEKDPFITLDLHSVGAVIRRAVELARSVKPDISIGICGEHGGCIETIAFLRSIKLDYVSCSPYRVPVARLASARCALLG